MKLLDLFCGGGGSAEGYRRAGFDEIVGVDIEPQPHYPFEFHQGNALEYPLDGFDAIHASPPCQAYCALKTMPNARWHPDLIADVRYQLDLHSRFWVIENVFGAPLQYPIMLCGSHFGLVASDGYELRRHRYFETVPFMLNPFACNHGKKTVGVYGAKARDIAKEKRHYAKPHESRGAPEGVVLPHKTAFEAMGIDWMNIRELSEAVPPAYTEYIGKQIIQAIKATHH